jgi:two-component system nitrate/nitrite response regulator NarL
MKLLIIAENPLARMGLSALLAGQSGVTIVGQTGGANLGAQLDQYQPDVMIWDWGWQTAPELPADVPVLALLKEASQAEEAWKAGARGLLLGESDADVLVSALTTVSQGLAVLEPSLAAALMRANAGESEAPTEALTSREMEVLQLLAEGLPNKIIANKLNITDHTVKFHVNAIMGKLNVQSRTEAVVRATKLGLIIL